jgi:SOS response regulatory protein OraA/RecX
MYIQECLLFNKSPDEIRFKLKQKRINAQIIQDKMNAFYLPEVKQEVLHSLIDKLMSQYQTLSEKQCFEKCATFLYRKVFKYEEFENILKAKIYNKT